MKMYANFLYDLPAYKFHFSKVLWEVKLAFFILHTVILVRFSHKTFAFFNHVVSDLVFLSSGLQGI